MRVTARSKEDKDTPSSREPGPEINRGPGTALEVLHAAASADGHYDSVCDSYRTRHTGISGGEHAYANGTPLPHAILGR